MALRIDDAVIRGWIDNTTPGETRGGIELVGIQRPLQLILRGNCWRDMAGARLDFVNPNPKRQDKLIGQLNNLHRGIVGDITASRRIKVPLISPEEFEDFIVEKKEIPYAWENCLYLEWFSLMNGRVVIETTGFELTLSQSQWEIDEQEDLKQRMENEQAVKHFMELISQANQAESMINDQQLGDADEFEWEKRLRVKDTLEEAVLFLASNNQAEPQTPQKEKERMKGRFGLVRRANRIQTEVMLYLGNSYLDDGPRSELAMTVAYIFNVLDEAWPKGDTELETGFRIAVLKRAIDASISAISACNTLEMEDDVFGALRTDVFIIRDEMVTLQRHLREQQIAKTNEANEGKNTEDE